MKKLIALGIAAVLSASVLAITVTPASADVPDSTITVNVTKEVVNGLQQNADFTIKLTCEDHDDIESASQTLTWRAPGNSPWHLEPEGGEFTLSVTDNWDDDVWCVVTETNTGGATSTTITCVDDDEATCDGAWLYIDDDDIQIGVDFTYGEFEVVNDFTPLPVPTTVAPAPVPAPAPIAAPAPVVVVSPRFTG